MAGLFDMFSGNPQSQGLLAAAAQILQASGPSTRPTSFGQILGSGLGAYQQQEQQARQTGQAEKLRGLQIKGVESDLTQQQSQIEKQARIAQAAQAAQGPEGFDQNAFVNNVAQFDPMGAMELRKSLAKAAPKFDSGITFVNGPDGKPVAVRTADDGSVKQVEGYAPREKLEFRDTGNAVLGVNPYTGERQTALAKGVSPDASLSAATQRRGQDITARGQNMVDARAAAAMPSNKPLPAAALRMQQSELDALSTASGIDGQLGKISKQLTDGKLSFGVYDNARNAARNYAGISDENSRNAASFRSTLEKLRNDSLRLNAGVQTDGDAQRAWNELFTNLNDTELVKQRLTEIRGINTRATQIRKLNVDGIRANYGHEPMDTSKYEQPLPPPSDSKPDAGAAAKFSITAPNGKTYNFPDAKALANFKLTTGLK